MSKYLPVRIKQVVRERARGLCEYCLCPEWFSTYGFSMEHIVPRIRKGTSDLDNLALSCSGCNGLKYTSVAGRDDITGEIVSLYHPRKHVWSEHFQWSEDGLKIVGQTPIGRTTVLRLELNRAGVVSIREALLLSGRHPMREDE